MFSADDSGDIIYGLGAIKGLGEGPIESLLAARRDKPFSDLFDLCSRTDPRKVNRRALEALIKSGALDQFGAERWVQMAALDDALKAAEQTAANSAAGMVDLFGEVALSADTGDVYAEHRKVRPWTLRELLAGEVESIGSFLSAHPIDEYEHELRKFVPRRIREMQAGNNATVAGLIVDVRTIKTQRGVMAVVRLDDKSAQMESTVYAETYSDNR
jgi:DNA polymerase-3 subunit alpha